jgi:hypothetical protein
MATIVYYNGVFLHNVSTREFAQQSVYDASGTDRVSTKFSLRFDGVIQIQTAFTYGYGRPPWIAEEQGGGQYTPGGGGATGAYVSAADAYVRVRQLLSRPRGSLYVVVTDETVKAGADDGSTNGPWQLLLQCLPTSSRFINHPDRDVSNGPKPQALELTQLSGNNLFRVSFSITCEKVECLTAGAVPWVLNHRWGVSEDMDYNFFTTRTISGILRLSGSGLSDTFNHNVPLTPEWFRGIVVPPLENGFRRESFDYAVANDGMTASYNLTDRQVHTSAPWPATSIEMTHTEMTGNGFTWQAEVDIRLSGPPHIDKRFLIARLVQLAHNKLRVQGQGFAGGGEEKEKTWRLLNASITDNIGEHNSVEGRWRIERFIPTESTIVGIVSARLGTEIQIQPMPQLGSHGVEYSPGRSHLPAGPWGYNPAPSENLRSPAFLLLRQCYLLQDPCEACHTLTDVSPPQFSPPTYPNITSNQTVVTNVPSITLEGLKTPKLSESHAAAIYIAASIENRYFTDYLRVQVPIARAVSGVDQNTAVIAQVGPGQAKREIVYDATRAGQWPMIPQPHEVISIGTLVGTLVHKSFAFQPPVPTVDGQGTDYHLRARYVYLLNRPPRDDEKLNVNKQPFMANPTGDEGTITISTTYDESMASGGTPQVAMPQPSSTP